MSTRKTSLDHRGQMMTTNELDALRAKSANSGKIILSLAFIKKVLQEQQEEVVINEQASYYSRKAQRKRDINATTTERLEINFLNKLNIH